jgi:hypothetical protein
MRVSLWGSVVLLLLVPSGLGSASDRSRSGDPAPQAGVAARAAEYIGYARSVRLTPEQKALRDRVLSGIPAPCCDKYSSATCCCPCNLAKTIWGLSNLLIARDSAGPEQVEKAVRAWIAAVNPRGFTGNACDSSGGCARPFSENGCGGMDEKDMRAAR